MNASELSGFHRGTCQLELSEGLNLPAAAFTSPRIFGLGPQGAVRDATAWVGRKFEKAAMPFEAIILLVLLRFPAQGHCISCRRSETVYAGKLRQKNPVATRKRVYLR